MKVSAAACFMTILLAGGPDPSAQSQTVPKLRPNDLSVTARRIAVACRNIEREDQTLLDNFEMKQLFAAPDPFFDQALNIVQDSQFSLSEKMVVVYGMQCLPMDKYLALGRSVLAGVEAGRSPPRLLFVAVLPGTNWSTRLTASYRDHRVKRFLMDVRKSNASDGALRGIVLEILSGELDRANRRAPEGYWGTRACPVSAR